MSEYDMNKPVFNIQGSEDALNSVVEHLRRRTRVGALRPTIFVHPGDDVQALGDKLTDALPAGEYSGFYDAQVYQSSFVKPGQPVFSFQRQSAWADFKIDPDLEKLINERAAEAFSRGLDRAFMQYFGVRPHLEDQPYNWQRRMGEGVLAWGDRLFERGLLDDPAIRWEYQKAIFWAIVRALTFGRLLP